MTALSQKLLLPSPSPRVVYLPIVNNRSLNPTHLPPNPQPQPPKKSPVSKKKLPPLPTSHPPLPFIPPKHTPSTPKHTESQTHPPPPSSPPLLVSTGNFPSRQVRVRTQPGYRSECPQKSVQGFPSLNPHCLYFCQVVGCKSKKRTRKKKTKRGKIS